MPFSWSTALLALPISSPVLPRCLQDELVELLGKFSPPIPVTYAGGVRHLEDCERVARLGSGRVDVSIGSALDIFGGGLKYVDGVGWAKAVPPPPPSS